jgi:membrane-bound serine protease (ClpP class)
MPRFARFRRAALRALLLGLPLLAVPGDGRAAPARYLRWDGPISPAAADYLDREIQAAARDAVPLVIVGLDTPGGLDTSMRRIVRAIGASPVPVAVWVGPPGSRAASAGCVIGLSAHVLAMAPGTNIGAAHPVSMGGAGLDSTVAGKAVNDAAAYVTALARQRNRNESWARDAVTRSVSVSAEEAVRLNVAEIVADDPEALLSALDGRSVTTAAGMRQLATRGLALEARQRDWRTDLLAVLTDPNVAYILLLLGMYGLFFELANPGALFPGVFGIVSLILALYGLSNLPVSTAGLLLILAGLSMLLLEIKIASHGLLAIGGIVGLAAGSLLLFESPLPFFRVSLSVMLPAVLVTAAFVLFLLGKGLSAQRRPPATGPLALVGRRGVAATRLAPRGSVFVDGTHWEAEGPVDSIVDAGQPVRIVAVERLSLKVRPEDSNPAAGGIR